MKTNLEILEMYGKCCVSENTLKQQSDYPSSKTGELCQKKDSFRLENIRGQKKIIEWFFN